MRAGSCQRPLLDPDGIGSTQSALHCEPRAPSPAWQKMYVYVWECVCVKKAWEELLVVPLSSPPFLKEYSGFNIGLPRSTAFGGIMSNSTKNYLKSFVKKKKTRLRWGTYNGREEITKCKAYNILKTRLNIPKCLSFSPSLLRCWKLETSQKMKLNLHRWPPNPVSQLCFCHPSHGEMICSFDVFLQRAYLTAAVFFLCTPQCCPWIKKIRDEKWIIHIFLWLDSKARLSCFPAIAVSALAQFTRWAPPDLGPVKSDM